MGHALPPCKVRLVRARDSLCSLDPERMILPDSGDWPPRFVVTRSAGYARETSVRQGVLKCEIA